MDRFDKMHIKAHETLGSLQALTQNINKLLDAHKMTQKDLADALGIPPTTVSSWVLGKKMPRDEALDAICLYFNIEPHELFMRDADELPANVMPVGHVKKLPIIGTICAGNGIVTEQTFAGEVTVDKSIDANYALRVKGDSMQDEIMDNDLVYIKQHASYQQGMIYAVVLADTNEAILRRIYQQGAKLMLTPDNKNYQPIVADPVDVYVLGKVVGIYRKMQGGR